MAFSSATAALDDLGGLAFDRHPAWLSGLGIDRTQANSIAITARPLQRLNLTGSHASDAAELGEVLQVLRHVRLQQ